MLNVRRWLNAQPRLLWWTPLYGWKYVAENAHGRLAGCGHLAWQSPGAFNLYAKLTNIPLPDSHNFHEHQEATLHLLVSMQEWAEQEIDGVPIKELAVFLKPKEFMQWFTNNMPTIRKLGPPSGFPTVTDFYNTLQKAVAIRH